MYHYKYTFFLSVCSRILSGSCRVRYSTLTVARISPLPWGINAVNVTGSIFELGHDWLIKVESFLVKITDLYRIQTPSLFWSKWASSERGCTINCTKFVLVGIRCTTSSNWGWGNISCSCLQENKAKTQLRTITEMLRQFFIINMVLFFIVIEHVEEKNNFYTNIFLSTKKYIFFITQKSIDK